MNDGDQGLEALRNDILEHLRSQGFSVENGNCNDMSDKQLLRNVHAIKKVEELERHEKALSRARKEVEKHFISGSELDPENIDLELIEVRSNTKNSRLFLWWNLMWWSLPYERAFGRQMRFILWDRYHDAPFGLIGLQSPPLSSSVRDRHLGLSPKEKDYWINQSMYGQRIGALPPYNMLLGGKMVTMALTSNEVREAYRRKYENRKTEMRGRILPSELLFISTTSAFGKSSMYERVHFNDDKVSEFIGYSSGAGTFQFSQELYERMLEMLVNNGHETIRGYGSGPSRKMKLISDGLRMLGIKNYHYHGIRRGYYLFPSVRNLKEVIHSDEEPDHFDRPIEELNEYWMRRYCLPRSQREKSWKEFNILMELGLL